LSPWVVDEDDVMVPRLIFPFARNIVAEVTRDEILRQERDILKKATAFSPGREVDEVRAHRWGENAIPRPPLVPRAWCQPKRLLLERADEVIE
jgi:hypothetical protein